MGLALGRIKTNTGVNESCLHGGDSQTKLGYIHSVSVTIILLYEKLT